MNRKSLLLVGLFGLLASCAYIPGPPIPLGLGPGLDQLVPLLLIVFVAAIAWRFVPDLWKRYGPGDTVGRIDETAQTTVRQRYARGEITRDEFLRMSDDLSRRD